MDKSKSTLEMVFFDPSDPRDAPKSAPREEPAIKPGDIVRRARGQQNLGTVERVYTRTVMRDREWGYRSCPPYKSAQVHWRKAVRWFGGKDDWRSKVRLTDLVRVDPETLTDAERRSLAPRRTDEYDG